MPRLIACAVVHDDPPIVFAAEDQETLNWVLALELVATTRRQDVSPDARRELRQALMDGRWGDAVIAWMSHTGSAVDVYSSMELYTAEDVEMASIELQFRAFPGLTVAHLRTTVTELGTGLGMLGYSSIQQAVRARPSEMVSVAPETWQILQRAREGEALAVEFEAAWNNRQAFPLARDAPSWPTAPHDLVEGWPEGTRRRGRPDRPASGPVYLVSCKYLSRIVINASPAHLFDSLQLGRHGRRDLDWYGDVAPAESAALYQAVRQGLPLLRLPPTASDLRTDERKLLSLTLAKRWPNGADEAYQRLSDAVAHASAQQWREALQTATNREVMFWRLLRIGRASYFVLDTAPARSLRLRIATPWDWRQQFRLRTFDIAAQPGRQSRVSWLPRGSHQQPPGLHRPTARRPMPLRAIPQPTDEECEEFLGHFERHPAYPAESIRR